ncbi:DUF1840 family protein [Thiomicrospira microaerophila]|uniref:DUF1840 family protein n=1 Tax=Thiomicrospira microaerophila TaxID=406020 RepID=UPI00200E30AE|nr:DUF1840 family protein [Thiomicrospira microaerophila]UQB42789.1 DUF1840 family protein [Thiomicrospira microaerophila]
MIRFKTKQHADVVMHDAMAEKLIKIMGASGLVPSALDHDMIAEAIDKLSRLAKNSSSDLAQDQVSLSQRAQPLIALLNTALTSGEPVMWQKTNVF